MLQFSQWGFDYVKVDWCGGNVEGLDAKTTYQAISDAAAKATATTGRELKLSVCNWGKQNPWNWGAGMSSLWRTNTDIIIHGQSPSWDSMLANFDTNVHPSGQHTGYYNDPDMLMVGLDGFTAAQNRSHMNPRAISGAPLLAGNNMATMSTQTRDILTNPEVVAVDQDPRGLQGVKAAEDTTGLQVYSKVLSGTGKRAVVLLNRTSSAQNMTVRWSDLGLTGASATVRNLWTRSNVGSFGTSYTVSVPAKDSVILTVTGGTEAASSTYEAEATANTKGGSAVNATCANCSGGTKVGNVGLRQQVPGRQQPGHDQRHQVRHLGLQRPEQPAVGRQRGRHHHQRERRPLPGLQRRGNRQRHQAGPVDLQRQQQPEVDPVIARTTVRGSVRRSV
jgi:hypothetical protein